MGKLQKNQLFTFVFVALISWACETNTIEPKDFPFIECTSVISSETGAEFKADILDLGERSIIEYGFVWNDSTGPIIEKHSKVILADTPKLGEFSASIQSGLTKDVIYFVRPFIKTDVELVYGNELYFTSKGSQTPNIVDFQPHFGSFGTEVTIRGQHFAINAQDNLVKFGNYKANIIESSEDRLVVIVPEVKEPFLTPIYVESAMMSSVSSARFDVYFPWYKQKDVVHMVAYEATYCIVGDMVIIINPGSTFGMIFKPDTDEWYTFNIPVSSGSYPLSFSVGNKAYFVLDGIIYEFDPYSLAWNLKCPFPEPIQYTSHAYAFGLDNYGYIGFCSNESKLWSYDPTTNVLIRQKDFPLQFNGANIIQTQALTMQNKGYLSINGTIWEYEPQEDLWDFITSGPTDAYLGRAFFAIENELYLGLGANNNWSEGYVSNKLWKFNLAANEWIQYQNSPAGMVSLVSFGWEKISFVLSGWTMFSSSYPFIWEFDPSKN